MVKMQTRQLVVGDRVTLPNGRRDRVVGIRDLGAGRYAVHLDPLGTLYAEHAEVWEVHRG